MISLELVPHSLEGLLNEAQNAAENYSEIGWINVPDIMRLDTRSYDAAEFLLSKDINVIPHLRTIDRSIEDTVILLKGLVEKGLKRVVIVSGDPIDSPDFKPSGVTPVELVKVLKVELPQLDCYGGLDPYRQNLRDEIDYGLEKLEAGYKGLFTQPFFCESLLEAYLKYFPGAEIWVGISPVTSKSSIRYWENVNKVAFPSDFESGLEYASAQAKRLLKVAEKYGQNSYLMPITIKPKEYLPAVFTGNP
jgi:methylenetetrahydrofolate reductase (NADPH)